MFLRRWGLILILASMFFLFFYLKGYQWLSFDSLKLHKALIQNWVEQHSYTAWLIFSLIYILMVAASIPGALFLTLLAGFLFGPFWGVLSVVFSATTGALIAFLAVQLAFRDWFVNKSAIWMKKVEKGFKQNAFFYLLSMRLIPLFPFWVLNIVPALLGMKKYQFVIATLLGILPGTTVYVMLGSGLGGLLDTETKPNLAAIFHLNILLPLIALALLSLIPVIYKKISHKNRT